VSKGVALQSLAEGADGERRRRFEEIYAAHRIPILGYALRRTLNSDDAADVLAETFLAAWRRLEEVPDGAESRLWLYGTARRVLANQHRGERRRLALADRLKADLAVSYRPPDHGGELEEVGAAFRRLPGADRELLALAGWEGLDAAAIGTVLGCSANAARIRLHRARRRLAAELASAPPPAPRPLHAHVRNGDPA
jgi:RNA polymerase sigma factor (sigma-70 family)